MRVLVVTACVAVISTASAAACPRDVRCVIQPETATGAEAPRKKATAKVPDVRSVNRIAPRAHLTFEPPRKLAVGDVEMPWIWQAVRERFESTMPRYDDDKGFTLMLAPVVVTTPSDTIPGLGVSGDF